MSSIVPPKRLIDPLIRSALNLILFSLTFNFSDFLTKVSSSIVGASASALWSFSLSMGVFSLTMFLFGPKKKSNPIKIIREKTTASNKFF